MIVIQLSDPHILAPGELLYRRFDTAEFLARAVARSTGLTRCPMSRSSPATSSITANPPNTSICERCWHHLLCRSSSFPAITTPASRCALPSPQTVICLSCLVNRS
jgi:hypothetical protein